LGVKTLPRRFRFAKHDKNSFLVCDFLEGRGFCDELKGFYALFVRDWIDCPRRRLVGDMKNTCCKLKTFSGIDTVLAAERAFTTNPYRRGH